MDAQLKEQYSGNSVGLGSNIPSPQSLMHEILLSFLYVLLQSLVSTKARENLLDSFFTFQADVSGMNKGGE